MIETDDYSLDAFAAREDVSARQEVYIIPILHAKALQRA